MKKLIDFWEKLYYTEPLLIVVLLYALTISLKYRNKHQVLKYIHLYVIALLMVFVSSTTSHLTEFGHPLKIIIVEVASHIDYFFTLVELFIFSHFYYGLMDKILVKKSIIILNVGFFIFFVSMLVIDNAPDGISAILQAKVYTVEAIILLLICLPFFIRLFKRPKTSALINDPSFWVSTGLLFFLTCTLPFSFLEPYIRENHSHLLFLLYPIFYIFYILLLLMIIRAYLCKPEKTI